MVPRFAAHLRAIYNDIEADVEVFDDWHAAGPRADDHWQEYEKARGRNQITALKGHAARNVFDFDKRHLDAADQVVLLLPAGKSGHLELGYCLGRGKIGHVVFDGKDPDRYDVMYQFAHSVWAHPRDYLEHAAFAAGLDGWAMSREEYDNG